MEVEPKPDSADGGGGGYCPRVSTQINKLINNHRGASLSS